VKRRVHSYREQIHDSVQHTHTHTHTHWSIATAAPARQVAFNDAVPTTDVL